VRLWRKFVARNSSSKPRALKHRRLGLGLEPLEQRKLLSISYSFSDGLLTVDSDTQADSITLSSNASKNVTINSVVIQVDNQPVPASSVSGITVNGDAGNDTINLADVDSAHGYTDATLQSGNVATHAGDGSDSVTGSDYPESIYGDGGADVLRGGTGNDTIEGGVGNDTVYGGAGNDWLSGNEEADYIRGDDGPAAGSGGNDCISGGSGNDSLYGDGGNDTIYGEDGSDQVCGDFGTTAYASYGAADGNLDFIWESSGYDLIYGDFYGSNDYGGNDTIYHFDQSGGGGTIYGQGGDDDIWGLCASILYHGGYGNDTIRDNGGNDTIYGDEGNDRIETSTWNGGNDLIYGGDGDDYIYAANQGNDVIHGDNGNDTIYTLQGADTIFGDAGADYLNSQDSTGDDHVYAGYGDSVYYDNGDTVHWV